MKTKLMAGLLAGSLTVGTIAMTFNGEKTLNDTMQYLKDSTQKLEMFKGNESKLVSAISTLKSSKSELLKQIEQLQKSNSDKATEIDTLNGQIMSLNKRIAELEELLANGGDSNTELKAENDRLNNELAKANAEITKANNLVKNLQTELDKQKQISSNIQPITSTELDNLINDTTTPTEPTNPTNPTYDYTIDTSSDTYYFQDITISIMGNMYIFEGTAQYPVIIHFSDGTTQNADPNGILTLDKKVVKIQYKTSAGTTKTIQVNR